MAARKTAVDQHFAAKVLAYSETPAGQALLPDAQEVVETLLDALEAGAVRAAERDAQGNWNAVPWVKRGILLGFRVGKIVEMSIGGHHGEPRFAFFDKHVYTPRGLTLGDGVR
ncbi:MAG: 2,3,4,5-tetrahydropyridine-2,6-dicarboxylate N-succinyltransferase, partial [Gemmatimonadaceae bacterium]